MTGGGGGFRPPPMGLDSGDGGGVGEGRLPAASGGYSSCEVLLENEMDCREKDDNATGSLYGSPKVREDMFLISGGSGQLPDTNCGVLAMEDDEAAGGHARFFGQVQPDLATVEATGMDALMDGVLGPSAVVVVEGSTNRHVQRQVLGETEVSRRTLSSAEFCMGASCSRQSMGVDLGNSRLHANGVREALFLKADGGGRLLEKESGVRCSVRSFDGLDVQGRDASVMEEDGIIHDEDTLIGDGGRTGGDVHGGSFCVLDAPWDGSAAARKVGINGRQSSAMEEDRAVGDVDMPLGAGVTRVGGAAYEQNAGLYFSGRSEGKGVTTLSGCGILPTPSVNLRLDAGRFLAIGELPADDQSKCMKGGRGKVCVGFKP